MWQIVCRTNHFAKGRSAQLYDMPVTGMPPVIDSDLGWTLGMVFRSYVKTADEVFSNVPGGARGYLVLTAAVNEDPMPIGALAQRLGIDKTVMTYIVDALEDALFVERRPCPGRDRRTKQVAGTQLGLVVWEKTQARLRRARTMCSPLSLPTSARPSAHCCDGSPSRRRRTTRRMTPARSWKNSPKRRAARPAPRGPRCRRR